MTPRRWTALAAALLLAGAALLAGALMHKGDARLSIARADFAVNTGAGDGRDISAHNSPSAVRNPRDPGNLAVADRIDTPQFSCALHVSTDGGRRWARTPVPIPPGEQRKCYAPDLAFTSDGTLHVSYVTLRGVGNVPNAVWVASSRDGGRSLGAPRRVTGRLAFQVRIAADPAEPGRLHLTWLQARSVGLLKFTAPGNPIVLSRSDDGGRTWSRPSRVSDPARERALAASAVVGAEGEVYVLYLDAGDDRLDYEGGHEGFGGPPYDGRFTLVVARSRDGGRTWAESVVDDRVVPVDRFVAFLPPSPSLALDRRSGRLYAAFHDARLGDADVWLWTLGPGDARWSDPVRVNDTPRGDGRRQYLPRVGVAPEGRVDVVYYDRRESRRDIHNRVSAQSSFDAGRTFTPSAPVSDRVFDARIGFGSEREMPDLGSRLAVVSDPGRLLAVWSDTRAGTDASNKQDIRAAELAAEPARGPAAGLLAGGAALVAAGLAAGLRGRSAARRTR